MPDDSKLPRVRGASVPVIVKAIVSELRAVIAPLQQRIAELEARPMQKWAGVHVENTRYSEASLATRNGSLWVSTKETPTTPGSDWVLIVKKGHFDR